MSRAFMVLWVTLTAAMAGVAHATVAHAQPVPPCAYTLSPPQVVQAPEGAVVTATLTPAGCAGPFRPYVSVACVQLQGAPDRCTQARGGATAQVFYGPYQPGATYISTGRGCGAVFEDAPAPKCQNLGPITAAL